MSYKAIHARVPRSSPSTLTAASPPTPSSFPPWPCGLIRKGERKVTADGSWVTRTGRTAAAGRYLAQGRVCLPDPAAAPYWSGAGPKSSGGGSHDLALGEKGANAERQPGSAWTGCRIRLERAGEGRLRPQLWICGAVLKGRGSSQSMGFYFPDDLERVNSKLCQQWSWRCRPPPFTLGYATRFGSLQKQG